MNKLILLAILAVTSTFTPLWGQCPSGDVHFQTQAQVDAFLANSPAYTAVHGDLLIQETVGTSDPIIDLSGLRTINSKLDICTNPSINILDGLQNETSVGGYLQVRDIDGFINLAGLDGITSVGPTGIYMVLLKNDGHILKTT